MPTNTTNKKSNKKSSGTDMAKMDEAAAEARTKLEKNIGSWSALDVAAWWKDSYMRAGHTRLGRILVELAKKNSPQGPGVTPAGQNAEAAQRAQPHRLAAARRAALPSRRRGWPAVV